MMSRSNAITGNHVGANGKQINLSSYVENQNTGVTFGDVNIYHLVQTFAQVNPLEYLFGQEGQNYLYSIAKDPLRQAFHPCRIETSRYCFVRHFKATSHFEEHLNGCVDDYPDVKTNKSIMEMLDHDSIQALSFWKSYPGNSSVLLHLHGETKERANWTTHFTLEMIGCIAQSDHATGAWQTSAVLAHFCAQQDDAFRWTQEVLLRDFLSQIHRSRLPELEAAHDCGTHRQEDGIFHDVAKKPAHMWELLRCAVTTAGIKSLYVFIDNLDYMQEKAQLTAIQEFNSSFHEFLVGCQQARITVKLVITSQSTEIDYHYPVPSRIALKADFDDRSK